MKKKINKNKRNIFKIFTKPSEKPTKRNSNFAASFTNKTARWNTNYLAAFLLIFALPLFAVIFKTDINFKEFFLDNPEGVLWIVGIISYGTSYKKQIFTKKGRKLKIKEKSYFDLKKIKPKHPSKNQYKRKWELLFSAPLLKEVVEVPMQALPELTFVVIVLGSLLCSRLNHFEVPEEQEAVVPEEIAKIDISAETTIVETAVTEITTNPTTVDLLLACTAIKHAVTKIVTLLGFFGDYNNYVLRHLVLIQNSLRGLPKVLEGLVMDYDRTLAVNEVLMGLSSDLSGLNYHLKVVCLHLLVKYLKQSFKWSILALRGVPTPAVAGSFSDRSARLNSLIVDINLLMHDIFLEPRLNERTVLLHKLKARAIFFKNTLPAGRNLAAGEVETIKDFIFTTERFSRMAELELENSPNVPDIYIGGLCTLMTTTGEIYVYLRNLQNFASSENKKKSPKLIMRRKRKLELIS